jgi:hypothetical protein
MLKPFLKARIIPWWLSADQRLVCLEYVVKALLGADSIKRTFRTSLRIAEN